MGFFVLKSQILLTWNWAQYVPFRLIQLNLFFCFFTNLFYRVEKEKAQAAEQAKVSVLHWRLSTVFYFFKCFNWGFDLASGPDWYVLAFLLYTCHGFLMFKYQPTVSQKRLDQKTGTVTATPTGTPATPIITPKVIVGSLSGHGTPSTKVVLSTKMGTPVTFQQNKNFQQSFATWVKQGQSTQGTLQSSVPVSLSLLTNVVSCYAFVSCF